MDSKLLQMLAGKQLITNTREKKVETKKPTLPGSMDIETDPHKKFIKMVIKEKPTKKVLVEQFQQFIDVAEAEL